MAFGANFGEFSRPGFECPCGGQPRGWGVSWGMAQDPRELVVPLELGCPMQSGTPFRPLLPGLHLGDSGSKALGSPMAEGAVQRKTDGSVASSRVNAVRVRRGGQRQCPVPRLEHPAVSRGQGGAKKPSGRSQRRQPSHRALRKHVPGLEGKLRLGEGLRPVSPWPPADAVPNPISKASGHPLAQSRPGRALSGCALPGCPPGRGDGGGPALIVSMGDDFQGEISSSVESLSFKAAHKMSPPLCSACGVLLSRRI